MGRKTLDEMNLAGKTVLVRVDLNLPVRDGVVSDASRIARSLPTLREIIAAGGRAVLLSHFARPKGRRVPEMSLRVVLPALEDALGQRVRFADDCIGDPAREVVAALGDGEVALLENTRFHAGEESNDADFAAALAELGDIYVNDAFSTAHRAHASTEAIAHMLPACAGRAMDQELRALEAALSDPQRPVVAVVGGAKVSTKIDLLLNLVRRVDHLVIGGGMANSFLAAQGHEVGRSLAERDSADTVRDIRARADETGCKLHLPVDLVVARELAEGAAHEVVAADACPADRMILDAGPQTVAALSDLFADCRTLIWNGPLGAFEVPPFDTATVAAARRVAELTRTGRLVSVAGGGDTVAALNHAGVTGDFGYVSGAGGAFLEWMEGRTLPGVAALES